MLNIIRSAIGQRLKIARLQAGLKQDDVATDFVRSRQAISSWERGRTLPDVLELRELCLLYGVSPNRILVGEDDPEGEMVRVLAQVSARPDFEESTLED